MTPTTLHTSPATREVAASETAIYSWDFAPYMSAGDAPASPALSLIDLQTGLAYPAGVLATYPQTSGASLVLVGLTALLSGHRYLAKVTATLNTNKILTLLTELVAVDLPVAAAPGAKGYTTAAAVNGSLGGTLSAEQQLQAAALVPVAEEWIDAYLGRSYGAVITDEPYRLDGGPSLYLRSTPVASVQAVKRWDASSHALTSLVLNTDYEARDLASGALRLISWGWDAVTWTWPDDWAAWWDLYGSPTLWVSYTPTSTIPQRVQRAATLLVAEWLAPVLNPDLALPGIKSYAVGQDLSVTFRDQSAEDLGIPAAVKGLLAGLKRLVIA